MNEEQFLASLKCLNSESFEEYYEKSLPPEERAGFQITLFKMLVRNYSPLMIIYAYIFMSIASVIGLIFPAKKKEIPGLLAKQLPSKSWYQSHQGNCSVVAVIKAVQARYGNNIFEEFQNNLMGGYSITLKDGVQLTLSIDEIELIKKKSGFRGAENKQKQNAYLAYAAIVKNAVNKGHFGSFETALNFFNSGSGPEYCAEMLGYINCLMIVEPMRGLNDIVVAYSKTNAMCINNGFIEGLDEKLLFAGHDMMGKILNRAFLVV